MPSLYGVRCRGLKTPGAREYRTTGWSVDRKESKKDTAAAFWLFNHFLPVISNSVYFTFLRRAVIWWLRCTSCNITKSLFMNTDALNLTSSRHFEVTHIKRFRPSGRSKQEASAWKGSQLWRIPTKYSITRLNFSLHFFSSSFVEANTAVAQKLFLEYLLGTGSVKGKKYFPQDGHVTVRK